MSPAKGGAALALVGVALLTFGGTARVVRGTPDATAGFAVRYGTLVSAYRINSAFVLPGTSLAIAVERATGAYEAQAREGQLRPVGVAAWRYRPPSRPGIYPLTVRRADGSDSIRLTVFVLVPASRVVNGRLNGYVIGTYARVRTPDGVVRPPPVGFIEVTPANRRTPVSPRFRLEQFLCKQAGGYPKYVALDARLLLALETLLDEANAAGYRVTSFKILSGFRTPSYNRAIGNVVSSRHQWGQAADIFVDEDGDGVMDDLNRDGRHDARDADVLIRLADRALGKDGREYAGGLGRYGTNRSHGPFVHLDVRGYRARW